MPTKGNPQEVAEVYTSYNDALRWFVSGLMKDSDNADDIMQEAFLKTYEASKTRRIKFPKSYLFTTARNLLLRKHTKIEARITDYIEDYSGPMLYSNEPSAFDTLSGRNELSCLGQAIGTLPPQCQKVMIYRLVHQMPQKKIAATLGISVSTTEKHIASGMEKCSEFMREHGYSRGNK